VAQGRGTCVPPALFVGRRPGTKTSPCFNRVFLRAFLCKGSQKKPENIFLEKNLEKKSRPANGRSKTGIFFYHRRTEALRPTVFSKIYIWCSPRSHHPHSPRTSRCTAAASKQLHPVAFFLLVLGRGVLYGKRPPPLPSQKPPRQSRRIRWRVCLLVLVGRSRFGPGSWKTEATGSWLDSRCRSAS
jgi:hypothetical protein